MTLSFRPLARTDFLLLYKWLSAPHVEAWWHEPLDLAGIEAKYGPRIDGKEPSHVFVVELESRAIGWIQWFRWSDYPGHAKQLGASPTSAGIDLAIGETGQTGKGIGTVLLMSFSRKIFSEHPQVLEIVTDPEELNVQSLRAFEKAGFVQVGTVRLFGESMKRRVVSLKRTQSS